MNPAPDHRTERFAVRMTADEVAMMIELARQDGLTGSDVLRQLVRREFNARGLTLPKKHSAKKK